MRVTVVLSGIPQFVTLHDLAYNLDKSFDTDEIGTFKVRDLPNIKNKRHIALDFKSGYDAMYAQNLLDGKPYTLPDGEIKVLRAKVDLNIERSPTPRSLLKRRFRKVSSSSADDDIPVSKMSSDQLRKVNKKMDAQLIVIEKQMQVLFSEHQLILEKKRIKRELKKLEKDKPSAKEAKRKRHQSDTSSSDEVYVQTEAKKKQKSKTKKSSSRSHRESSFRRHRESSSRSHRESFNADLRDRLNEKSGLKPSTFAEERHRSRESRTGDYRKSSHKRSPISRQLRSPSFDR